jgi:hypothetical protein
LFHRKSEDLSQKQNASRFPRKKSSSIIETELYFVGDWKINKRHFNMFHNFLLPTVSQWDNKKVPARTVQCNARFLSVGGFITRHPRIPELTLNYLYCWGSEKWDAFASVPPEFFNKQ